MIKAAIIDDERNNIDNLKGLLQLYCPEILIAAVALNAKTGAGIILEEKPDLIFLDIQMPDKNGFEMLQGLPGHNFEVIFVTAFDKYGIQAIKFSAIDYLLKPVNADELKLAVQKAEEKIRNKKQNLQLENLLELLNTRQQKNTHRLALPTAKETRFVNPEEIIRCESSNVYTSFYLTNGEKIMVSKPIFEYDELLQEYDFIRCHQSHLVNKKYIKSLVKEFGGQLLLEDKTLLPISRSKKEMVIKTLTTLGR